MNIEFKKIGFCLLITFVIFSCTNKKNPIGFQEGPDPISITIPYTLFSNFYSFEDSCRNSNSDKLIIGNYESNDTFNKAISLIKFSSLPDSFYEVSDVSLHFMIKNSHNFEVIDNTTLKIGKVISENWFETTVLWRSPTDSTEWMSPGEFSEADYELCENLEFTVDDDSVCISLPDELLENWIIADSVNYGLVLFSDEEDSFLEIHSSESSDDNTPKLYFDFRETEEDTVSTYNRTPTHDVFIYETDNDYSKWENQLILSNIQPIKMYMKFDLPDSIFTNEIDSDIQDTILFIQRLTINKADLILKNNGVNAYPLDGTIYIDPFIMISENINLEDPSFPMLSEDDYEDLYISSSSDSLTSEEFKVDIIKIVQSFTSGEYENHGVMLKSIYENKDFIHLEFNLEPEIQITFVPPYLDE
ncbi:MAG: DNRLRE domain-containing protein [Candidatus Cloacimonetes bacterium]|nr:DNRLRE domain-containing protein [Candidatus Cloacimonadota bacterium]